MLGALPPLMAENPLAVLSIATVTSMIPFFPIDRREITIGGKPVRRQFLLLLITFHVGPLAVFFCLAKDDPDALGKRLVTCKQLFHGKDAGDGRSLVIDDAPPIEAVTGQRCLQRRIIPAFPCRHHVQVTEDADQFLALSDLSITVKSVDIFVRKSKDAQSCSTYSKAAAGPAP